jgi:D-amino-acid dehydrogenase
MQQWAAVLGGCGVDIREQTAFTGFRTRTGRATAAETTTGAVPADAFVVATGAWTPLLFHALGVRIPIQPGKGYSVTFSGAAGTPGRPCLFEEARMVATPWEDGFRLGGTMEFSGFDDTLPRARIEALLRGARCYLAAFDPGRVEEQWAGWRPMTWDGVPVVDRLPRRPNVVVAAGHNMMGLTMAPAPGRLVAEMISGERPHVDPAPYRLSRFRRSVS